MNRMVLVCTLVLVASPLYADTGHTCGENPDFEYRIDASTRYQGDDLVLYRDQTEVARLTPDPGLVIEGTTVALDQDQRAAARAYMDAHDELVTQAKKLGAEGARFGVRTAFRALTAVFTLGANRDRLDAEIEAEAAEFESFVKGTMCEHMQVLHLRHVELAAAVPEFDAAVPLKPTAPLED